jgi:hypothetical protein
MIPEWLQPGTVKERIYSYLDVEVAEFDAIEEEEERVRMVEEIIEIVEAGDQL